MQRLDCGHQHYFSQQLKYILVGLLILTALAVGIKFRSSIMWMWPLVIAISFTGALGAIALSDSIKPSQSTVLSKASVMNYEIFRLAADTFIKSNPSNGTFNWTNLKMMNSSSFANAKIPATWKIIVYAPQSYVICTDHAAADVPNILARYTPASAPYQKDSTTLVASTNTTNAVGQATLCN